MNVEKLRMEAGIGITDNTMECLQKPKNTIAMWSTIPISGHLS